MATDKTTDFEYKLRVNVLCPQEDGDDFLFNGAVAETPNGLWFNLAGMDESTDFALKVVAIHDLMLDADSAHIEATMEEAGKPTYAADILLNRRPKGKHTISITNADTGAVIRTGASVRGGLLQINP